MTTLPKIQLAEQHLTAQLREFLSSLDELELSPEQEQVEIQKFFAAFLENEQEQNDKINACCWYLTRLNHDAQYYREQTIRMSNLARFRENRLKTFKNYLSFVIEQKGGKYSTKDFPSLFLKNDPPSVEIDNKYQGDIPDEYLKPRDLEDVLNKTTIAKTLKAGVELPFARLVRKGKTLMGLK